MATLSLNDKIDILHRDIQLSTNPKSHLRCSRAMGLLMAAKALWLMPGRQAIALMLEEESNELLRNTSSDF